MLAALKIQGDVIYGQPLAEIMDLDQASNQIASKYI